MSEVEDMINEAKSPGVFSIIEAVKDRAFPESSADIYLDESLAFMISELDEALARMSNQADGKKVFNKKELDEFEKRRDELVAKREKLVKDIGGAKYIFSFKGISEGMRQDIYDKAIEKFPITHEKNRNPFTGQLEKEQIENLDRDRLFSDLMWEANIVKIESPDGDVQNGISFEEATELRRNLPAASVAKISEAIERLRIASAAFMMSINEDFLAKS